MRVLLGVLFLAACNGSAIPLDECQRSADCMRGFCGYALPDAGAPPGSIFEELLAKLRAEGAVRVCCSDRGAAECLPAP